MDADEADEEREVAWLAMPEKAPVIGKSGEEIGRTEELLGDKEGDIFHGIGAVRRWRSAQTESRRSRPAGSIRTWRRTSSSTSHRSSSGRRLGLEGAARW